MSEEKKNTLEKQIINDILQNLDYVNEGVLEFSEIAQGMIDTYAMKNRDYGNSFEESLDEDGLIASKVRIGDKYRRFANLLENDILVEDESIEDTLLDMANYAVMTVMWCRKNRKEEQHEMKTSKGSVITSVDEFEQFLDILGLLKGDEEDDQ